MVDEFYYGRWERWLNANGKLMVAARRLEDYFSDRIADNASFLDFWADYQSWMRVVLGRRFVTTRNGFFGWVPDNRDGVKDSQARSGDIFAIISGCSTPILLRPFQGYFQVFGEAYLQGAMNGEVSKLNGEGKYQVQELLLC